MHVRDKVWLIFWPLCIWNVSPRMFLHWKKTNLKVQYYHVGRRCYILYVIHFGLFYSCKRFRNPFKRDFIVFIKFNMGRSIKRVDENLLLLYKGSMLHQTKSFPKVCVCVFMLKCVGVNNNNWIVTILLKALCKWCLKNWFFVIKMESVQRYLWSWWNGNRQKFKNQFYLFQKLFITSVDQS